MGLKVSREDLRIELLGELLDENRQLTFRVARLEWELKQEKRVTEWLVREVKKIERVEDENDRPVGLRVARDVASSDQSENGR